MKNLDLRHPACILLCGKPRKGKTNCIRFLIQKHSLDRFQGCAKFEFGICFVRTKFNHDYDFLPDEYVYEGYDQEVLEQYLNGIQESVAQGNKAPANFVIFDDLIGLLSKNDPFLINFFGLHRHTNTTILLATQHLKSGASTTLREVCTHAVIFNSKTFNTITSLYENFGGLFPNLEEFKKCLQETTAEPYTAMLYMQDEDNMNKNYVKFKCPDVSKWDYQLDY